MRDREPHRWSLTLPWRPFGVTVRIHVLFPCVMLGVILWVATARAFDPRLWPHAITFMAMLFVAVVLHQAGRLAAARAVNGDAPSVVLWPLGGLEFPDVPHDPAAHWWVAAAGPAVNLGLALAAAGSLALLGFIAPFNPFASPFNPRMHHWREHKTYFSLANPGEAELHYYQKPDAPEGARAEQVKLTFARDEDGKRQLQLPLGEVEPTPGGKWRHRKSGQDLEPAVIGRGPWLLAQFFAVNWMLFLVNLLPAYPLDGSRMFQAWLWRRGDYRSAIATTAYVGFFVMLGVGVYAIAVNGLLPALLAAVIYVRCREQLMALARSDEESPANDYDFSEGYTSLEREPPPAPPKPRPGWLRRWLDERAARRREREHERRLAEERRLDELLDKIHHQGRAALTDEELRFLTRVSGRYPHRKS